MNKLSQEQLVTVSGDIIANLERIVNHFQIERLKIGYNSAHGSCPIHGGDNMGAFNLYWNNDLPIWKCYSHHCHDTFKDTPVGLIRGLLSRQKYGWESKGDNTVTFPETIHWLSDFLGKNLKAIEVSTTDKNKSVFAYNLKALRDRPEPKGLDLPRENVRDFLEVPSKYYLDRGHSKAMLTKYDVGFCSDPTKLMYNRSVVPVYNDAGTKLVGCMGRSLHNYCPFCKNCHREGSVCLPDEGRVQKWLNNKGFQSAYHLYNYWEAKKYILESHTAIIVEGASNVWRLEQEGIHNSVSIFGSSLSPQQKSKLDKSGAMTIIVLTDNDAAGRIAVESITKMCSRQYKIVSPEFASNDIDSLGSKEIKELFRSIT